MLFNSFEFLLLFLPVSLLGFFLIGRLGNVKFALTWLITCSLLFHGYWKASYTWLFVVSIITNYWMGLAIESTKGVWRIRMLVGGLIFNLGLLGYFKYSGFFANVVSALGGPFVNVGEIILPLAISFYTFQQISFLVDTYKGRTPRYGFIAYASYLAFFPHLIAGPIVRHNKLIGQLLNPAILRPVASNLTSGMAIIFIGLFKKVVLADGAAAYVTPIFFAAGNGGTIGFAEGWIAAILFSFVVYFDFSGYSDIAIGLAKLFNVRFPENFASPYKAGNIIDFWRRWHISLSSFLRDYLYIPLGGNRHGVPRKYVSLMITMVLGGLWHGAALNFIVWGGLHGAYLLSAHAWQSHCKAKGICIQGNPSRVAGRALTYLAVVIAWVFFRASSLEQATEVLAGMAGLNGLGAGAVDLPSYCLENSILEAAIMCVLLLGLVNLAPNTQQFMRRYRPVTHSVHDRLEGYAARLVWHPGFIGVSYVVGLGVCAVMNMDQVQSFIYFRF